MPKWPSVACETIFTKLLHSVSGAMKPMGMKLRRSEDTSGMTK